MSEMHEGPILIVEDDDTLRMALRSILTGRGYLVEDASTLASGLALAQKKKLGLLVLDIKLPDGTGWEFLEHIRSSLADARPSVILISSSQVSRAQLREYGVDRFLPKPFSMPDLVEAIEFMYPLAGSRNATESESPTVCQ